MPHENLRKLVDAKLDRWTFSKDEVGDPVLNQGQATVQISGNLGGGSVVIEGSNQHPPTEWSLLHAPDFGGLEVQWACISGIAESPAYIRASLKDSNGAASVQIDLISR